jgi:hypothetical protein
MLQKKPDNVQIISIATGPKPEKNNSISLHPGNPKIYFEILEDFRIEWHRTSGKGAAI